MTMGTIWLLAAALSSLGLLDQFGDAVKCLDCVGQDCMGKFCDGDYCLLGHYAPRWGTIEWGEPQVVKGCLTGRMLEENIRNHCETADEEGEEPFTCICDKDYCNSAKGIQRLDVSPVPLVTCVCDGAHCKSKTCIGELCSYVINHRTRKSEQGCVNASVPLVERRSAGACMIPPITGAMHHTVSKDPHDLLATESCVCATDYCNSEKPEVTQPEKMKCQAFVSLDVMGNKLKSRNTTCTGEYCFKAQIKSKLGHMSEYKTMGCASFLDEAELAEELRPVGCAKFQSDEIQVEACFQTSDKSAISRARANQESVAPRRKSKWKKPPKKPPPKMEVEYEDDDEEEDEEEEEAKEEEIRKTISKGKQKSTGKNRPREKEQKTGKVKEEKQERKNEENENVDDEDEEHEQEKSQTEDEERGEDEGVEDEEEDNNEETKENEKNEATTPLFIFEKPTEPPIPDDSNITLITVFIMLMVLIVMSGAVWKFELHKRLFRARYDTVAGG